MTIRIADLLKNCVLVATLFTLAGAFPQNAKAAKAVKIDEFAGAVSVLFDDGTVRDQIGWNSTTLKKLGGLGNSVGVDPNSFSLLEYPEPVKGISTGGQHQCALLASSSVTCWGHNYYGQLGFFSHELDFSKEDLIAAPNVDFGPGVVATKIATGRFHTCAILKGSNVNGAVKCWGRNQEGQLGLGTAQEIGPKWNEIAGLRPVDLGTERKAIDLALGEAHSCALLDDGKIKCWGNNYDGQLGIGNPLNQGDDPGEMGNALPSVDLGAGRSAVAVSAGYYHTCALLDNGRIKCWGANGVGQLGLGDTERRGDASGEMGDSLPYIDLGSSDPVVSIDAGFYHTCAVLQGGMLKCWGANSVGQLGIGKNEIHWGTKPSHMGNNLPNVQLGEGNFANHVTAGEQETCALLNSGRVKCWGFRF